MSYAIQSYRIATSDPSYARLITAYALLTGIWVTGKCAAYVVLARREKEGPHRHMLFGLHRLYFRSDVLEQEEFNFCVKVLLVIANNLFYSDLTYRESLYLFILFWYLSYQHDLEYGKQNRMNALLLFSKFVLIQNVFYSFFSDLNLLTIDGDDTSRFGYALEAQIAGIFLFVLALLARKWEIVQRLFELARRLVTQGREARDGKARARRRELYEKLISYARTITAGPREKSTK